MINSEILEGDRKLLQNLGLAPIELCHATAYHAWTDGQKPGDAKLTLDRNLYCRTDEFNQPFFMPLGNPCALEAWKPVRIRISANVKELGKMFSFEYFVPKGAVLKLIGAERPVNVGSCDFDREAPVFCYEIDSQEELNSSTGRN